MGPNVLIDGMVTFSSIGSRSFAVRLPRMTTRRWAVIVVLTAVNFAMIVQPGSHPLAFLAFLGTLAAVILSPAMLLLIVISGDDRTADGNERKSTRIG
jgi:hypothetical protein